MSMQLESGARVNAISRRMLSWSAASRCVASSTARPGWLGAPVARSSDPLRELGERLRKQEMRVAGVERHIGQLVEPRIRWSCVEGVSVAGIRADAAKTASLARADLDRQTRSHRGEEPGKRRALPRSHLPD